MPQSATITVNEINPGHLYQVVEVGAKPTRFLGAFVIGAEAACPHKAVTVRMPDGIGVRHWPGVGTCWGQEDIGARFLAHYGPLVLMPPSTSSAASA